MKVENRSDFADLNEMQFNWKIAGESGLAAVTAPPGQQGILEIPIKQSGLVGKELEIKVHGPRKFMVDAYRYTLGGASPATPPPLRPAGTLKLTRNAQTIRVAGDGFSYVMDTRRGQLTQASVSGYDLPLAGPCLTIVPRLDDESPFVVMYDTKEPIFAGPIFSFTPHWGLCTAWKASSVVATKADKTVSVTISALMRKPRAATN